MQLNDRPSNRYFKSSNAYLLLQVTKSLYLRYFFSQIVNGWLMKWFSMSLCLSDREFWFRCHSGVISSWQRRSLFSLVKYIVYFTKTRRIQWTWMLSWLLVNQSNDDGFTSNDKELPTSFIHISLVLVII